MGKRCPQCGGNERLPALRNQTKRLESRFSFKLFKLGNGVRHFTRGDQCPVLRVQPIENVLEAYHHQRRGPVDLGPHTPRDLHHREQRGEVLCTAQERAEQCDEQRK